MLPGEYKLINYKCSCSCLCIDNKNINKIFGKLITKNAYIIDWDCNFSCVSMYVCLCVWPYVWLWVCIVCVCVCAFLCVCARVYAWTCVCTGSPEGSFGCLPLTFCLSLLDLGAHISACSGDPAVLGKVSFFLLERSPDWLSSFYFFFFSLPATVCPPEVLGSRNKKKGQCYVCLK